MRHASIGLAFMTLGLLSAASSVRAADLIEAMPVEEEAVKADYSAWYIRGDAGYVFKSSNSGEYDYYNGLLGSVADTYRYDDITLKSSYTLGGGVGYRFAEHFRSDLSLDYMKRDVEGHSPCIQAYGQNDCSYNDSAKADIWTTMANAYVDLPYFGPLTPYFGAGLGFAHVSYGEMRNEINCEPGGVCLIGDQYVGHHEGEESWRFASSLMAGVSFDLSRQLKLDTGYRYTRIFEGDAYGYDENDKADGATGVQGRDHGFNIHALRVGLRYEFF